MWKLIKIIFVILAGLGLVFLVGNYYSEKKMEEFKELLSQKGFSQFESITPGGKEVSGETQYKDFITPDGNLKVTYLSDWMEIKDEKFLEETISGEIADKYNLRFIFLAQKIKDGKFLQLVVSKGVFNNQESFEEIVDIIKESDHEQGWETETINSETKDNKTILETKYKKADRPEIHSQGKIILANQEKGEVYITTVSTLEKDWQYLKEEINNIIDSVQLLD